MNFVKFVSLLESRCLFFCRADRLGDPFEGSFVKNLTLNVVNVDNTGETGRETMPITEIEASIRRSIFSSQETLIRSTFVNSWYSRESDSAAMWSLFATVSDGVAIKSTVGKLKSSFEEDSPIIQIGSVAYRNFETAEGSWGNALLPFLMKREEFDHEHEVRALMLVLPNPPEMGTCVPVRLDVLIEGIVIAPQAEKWFAELVSAVVMRYGLNVNPQYSPLAAGPYRGD
jgi:hypothetical protein